MAVLPVVLVALAQVIFTDVPVDDLVHCNTKEKVEMELFATSEISSEQFPHAVQKTSGDTLSIQRWV